MKAASQTRNEHPIVGRAIRRFLPSKPFADPAQKIKV